MNDDNNAPTPSDKDNSEESNTIGGPVVIPTRALVVVAVAAFVGAAAGAAVAS